MHLILFVVFAAFCLAGAVNLLFQTHPINSALSLIVVMTSIAVLYLLLGAEFLAAAQIIVYAGAHHGAVHLCGHAVERRPRRAHRAQPRVSDRRLSAVVVLLAVLATVVMHIQGLGGAAFGDSLSNAPGQTNLEQLSQVLFTNLLLPFEVTSVLILVAILGAVALARHTEPERTVSK